MIQKRPELVSARGKLSPEYLPAFLAGAHVEVERKSAATGALLVKLLEARGVYQAGYRLLVKPEEVLPLDVPEDIQ